MSAMGEAATAIVEEVMAGRGIPSTDGAVFDALMRELLAGGALTRADGFGAWHGVALTEADALTAILAEIDLREARRGDWVPTLEPCPLDGAHCWRESTTNESEAV